MYWQLRRLYLPYEELAEYRYLIQILTASLFRSTYFFYFIYLFYSHNNLLYIPHVFCQGLFVRPGKAKRFLKLKRKNARKSKAASPSIYIYNYFFALCTTHIV